MKYNKLSYTRFIKRNIRLNLLCLSLLLINSFLNIIYPYCIEQLIDQGIGAKNIEAFLKFSFFTVVTICLNLFIGYVMKMKFLKLGQNINCDIKQTIFNCCEQYTAEFFTQHQTGDFVSILENDVKNVETLYSYLICDFISNIMIILGVGGILFRLDWILTIIVISMICVFAIFQKKLGVDVKKYSRDLSIERGKIQSYEQEFFENYTDIKNVNGISYFNDKLFQEQKNILHREKQVAKVRAWSRQIAFLFQSICQIFALIYGGFQVIQGVLSVGALFSLTMYIKKLYSPISAMFELYIEIQKTQASVHRVNELIDNQKYKIQYGKEKFPEEEVSIELNNISFGYKTNIIFKDFNERIDQTDHVAIIGQNGAGKSTLFKLLMRTMTLDQGSIQIANRNIMEYQDADYRNHVIALSQKVFIFTGTVYENITLFNYKVSEEKVIEALKLVGLFDDVMSMQKGIHTILGAQGLNLSGGQAQKLCIARVVILNPDIILLDEPTAALDLKAEQFMLQQIYSTFQDKIIVAITHRPEVLRYCNRVIDLERCGIEYADE